MTKLIELMALGFLLETVIVGSFLIADYITPSVEEQVELKCPEPIVSLECPKADVSLECPTIEIPVCPDCKCGDCGTCQYVTNDYGSHFQKVISTVAFERDYEYDHMSWNCDEMSTELKKRLNNAGYRCKTRVGYYKNGTDSTKHQWVECSNLIIEATNGQIVHPDDFWRYN